MAGRFEYGMRIGSNRAYAEGRAKAFGVGPDNPHASTSQKYTAWQAGNAFDGSRDSTALGQAGWSTVWTGVTFDGTNDRLSNSTNLGLSANATYTMAVAFRVTAIGGGVAIVGANAAGVSLLGVGALGELEVNSPFAAPYTGNGFYGWFSAAGVIQAGVDYVVHIAADKASNTVEVWLNGQLLTPATAATWAAGGTFSVPTSWQVGGTASAFFPGRLGLFWFDVGQRIRTPASFFPANNLGAQLANPGARPAAGFGGVQTAANWNAGTNLGDGTGTWTMAGAVA